MALNSKLFRGDRRLEAAATSDPAHITPGSRGDHVAKIQAALNTLDGAKLTADGVYGPATAAAVLAYKRKRGIINKAYQTSADNIVGKMTTLRLDEELRAEDAKPGARIEITPRAPARDKGKAFPRYNVQALSGNTFQASSSQSFTGDSSNIAPANFNVPSVEVDPGQTVDIDIKNGRGYQLTLTEFQFATNSPSALMIVPGISDPVSHFALNVDSITIKARGIRWGSPILFAQNFSKGPAFVDFLVVNVRDVRPDKFHPTSAHRHEPVAEPDEWNRVCEECEKDPDAGFTLKSLARVKASPETVTGFARQSLAFKPLANKHFEHYLNGAGATVNEDANINSWIRGDSNARTVIAKRIRENRRGQESNVHTMFEFNQLMFSDGDAQFSFGTIDNFEVAADFVKGEVEVWFEDTYEWHPPYRQYTKPFRCPDQKPRDTHFGHAALVQMKTRGAKDFQMRGRATLPMSIFPGL